MPLQLTVDGMDYFDYTRKYRNFDPYCYGQAQRDYAGMIDRVFGLRGKTVLDLGCAGGSTLKAFCEVCGADALGCDINARVIARCPFKKKRRRLACVPTEALSDYYPAGCFDLVHSQQVFEHFPDWPYSVAVIREIAQVVKPGGLVYVGLVAGPHKTPDQLRTDPTEDSTHINIWPLDQWRRAFILAGFVDVDRDYQPRFEREPVYRNNPTTQMIWKKED